MSSQLKPIELHGKGGPNPTKVAMLLEELGIPYSIFEYSFEALKQPPFLSLNPNGRMPAIVDPNYGDFTLWESGAIIEYLVERYDTTHKLSFPSGSPESFYAKQWLFFQASGQGPYYGQSIWFKKYHPEKVPSAYERYVKEINRVTGVLEESLAKRSEELESSDDGPWLVGGKFSYADLAWVPWQKGVALLLSKEDFDPEKYPHVSEWLGKLSSRESVKKASIPPPQ